MILQGVENVFRSDHIKKLHEDAKAHVVIQTFFLATPLHVVALADLENQRDSSLGAIATSAFVCLLWREPF